LCPHTRRSNAAPRSNSTKKRPATGDVRPATAHEEDAVRLIEYAEASAEVRAVYDDIMATRKIDWVNDFWKVLANHPATLRRTWDSVKQVMAPGELDPLTKEMVYLAVSAANGCRYCIASHTAGARKAGMTDTMLGELLAVVGMACETNALADAYQIPVDDRFLASPADC
jgi:AhpD family alkylhydroperoxidase